MLAVLVFVIILGVLVFVHELGHFLVARRNGIKAWEFGFGFPPRAIGIQKIYGDKMEKISETKNVDIDVKEYKNEEGAEIIEEKIVEKTKEVDELKHIGKWRIIWGSKDGDDENEREDLDEAHENKFRGGTIYSLNWIPIGGFVKIKGEDGGNKDDTDSFSGKSAWTRVKVLAAGVIMNFILAWVLISLALMVGAPESSDSGNANPKNAKIQIAEIAPNTPASSMGLKVGDEIAKNQIDSNGKNITLGNIKDTQDFINSQKGKEISLRIRRGNQDLVIKGMPRENSPNGEGPLGIALVETTIVRYPWYQAIWKGFLSTLDLIWAILMALFGIIKSLFMGKSVGADVAGPIGIAVLTKQVTQLGLVYVLQFAALLSINLGIINALPIPALDGGRILFVMIEKIKGSPVNQKTEQLLHTVFFILLLMLMAVVTFRDVLNFAK